MQHRRAAVSVLRDERLKERGTIVSESPTQTAYASSRRDSKPARGGYTRAVRFCRR